MGGARLRTELLFGRRLPRDQVLCSAVPANGPSIAAVVTAAAEPSVALAAAPLAKPAAPLAKPAAAEPSVALAAAPLAAASAAAAAANAASGLAVGREPKPPRQ